MASMQTPLLAEDSHDEPALNGGNNTAEESALSRLIAESTPPVALMPFSPAIDETTTTTTNNTATNAPHQQQQHKPASLITVLAGTFLCLQWGFVWGAYFSDSWMDSHLQIFVSWPQRFYHQQLADVVIQEASVFSLASDLKDDHDYAGLVGLWLCSVIMPCVFMIVCPIWILTDYTVTWTWRNRRAMEQVQQNRLWLELTIRLSLLVSFIMLILDVAIGGIELAWDDTDLQVHNRLRGPFMSYLLGGACALLSVVVLRMPYLEHIRLLGYPTTIPRRTSSPTNIMNAAENEEPPAQAASHAPPANAFRLPWLSSFSANDDDDDGETEPLVDNAPSTTEQSPPPSGNTQHQNRIGFTTITPERQKLIIFQTGLLALLLWIPALALAQFRVLYGGMVVELVKTSAFNVYVWQIPGLVWHTGVKSGTPKWMLLLSFSIIAAFVVILPVVAHLVGVMAWMCGGRSRAKLRDVLQLLHPTLCGIPFSIAIFVTVPSFINIGENLDKAICSQIETLVQNQCLISGGVRLAGCWFLVAQSIALELFIFLTIRWTAPKSHHRIVV